MKRLALSPCVLTFATLGVLLGGCRTAGMGNWGSGAGAFATGVSEGIAQGTSCRDAGGRVVGDTCVFPNGAALPLSRPQAPSSRHCLVVQVAPNMWDWDCR